MNKIKFYFVLIFFCSSIISNAQKTIKIDAYKIESDGYFSNISVSDIGIIATDNYASKIYLIQNGIADELVSAAGCGRYYTISPDKKKIGFKYISADGKQTPALLDITTKIITKLHSPVDLCGQVSFSSNEKIAFTISNMLHVLTGNTVQTYDLGTYANIASISPDGNKIIYNDTNDQLFIFDFHTLNKFQISDNSTGFVYPKWSPDGKKISCNSLSGDLYIYNYVTTSFKKIDENAGSAVWSDDSKNIYFQKNNVENFEFKGSDIYRLKFDGSEKINITNSPDIHEMSPNVSGNNLFFHTYENREIIKATLNANKTSIALQTILFKQNSALTINFFNVSNSNRAVVRVPGTVPYVHQVYDTPEWHYGYGSCAPTTSVMAFAYYNLLPKWPITTSNGVGNHNSDYGAYVADKYRYNEIYYQDVSATGGNEDAWGGYGYLWTGSNSPNSKMKTYLENHGLTSNQLWTTSCTYANTTTEINLGFPHPICNYLTTSGHLILAIGYLSTQHTMIFNDPYGNKNNPGYPNANGADAYYDWPGYSNGYQNLDASGTNGGVAWTTKARGAEVAYNDTIIDDVFYNHGFYMNNSQNGSIQRYFRDQKTGGFNNHFWWTGTVATADVCFVTWTPTIATSGLYEIKAFLPGGASANAAGAVYKIHHAQGITKIVIDQNLYAGQWVSLGSFTFAAGQSDYVYLGDSTGNATQYIAFDAMQFNKVSPIVNPPVAYYTSNISNICEGDTIQFSDLSTNASTYLWQFENGNPATSNIQNPSVSYDTSGTFQVKLIVSGAGGTDSIIDPIAINVNPNAHAAFTSNVISGQAPLTVLFSNGSQNATNYIWNFGDGVTASDGNPYHIYNTAGDYTVRLIAINSICASDTSFATIHVDPNVGIETNIFGNAITISPNPFRTCANIAFELVSKEHISVIMTSVLGKKHEIALNKSYNAGKHLITINSEKNGLTEGVYMLTISIGNQITYKKVVVNK